jgi:hypothetical protein
MKRKKLRGLILLLEGITLITIIFVFFNLKAKTGELSDVKKEPPQFGELRIVNKGDAYLFKPAGHFS